mgnify:FL=1
MVTNTEFKIIRVDDEIRIYKCDNDIITYHVMSRYDMTRLTDMLIDKKVLGKNHHKNVLFCKQWFNYTK